MGFFAAQVFEIELPWVLLASCLAAVALIAFLWWLKRRPQD
jgi:hypothetical protein